MANSEEVWQVEVNGQIYETNLAELAQWIDEGALIPQDKVRRNNLRWLEAGKVPVLYGFFNAKELGISMPVSPTITDGSPGENENVTQPENFATEQNVMQNAPATHFTPPQSETQSQTFQTETKTFTPPPQINNDSPTSCALHSEAEPKFICETCMNAFCPQCPNSYGGNVKICPICGAMCKPIKELKAKREKSFRHQYSLNEKFGFSDFGRALAFPFKYKPSLVFGALMFMFFTLGQSASGIGGMVMLSAAIFCTMMANALTFGILANTVENFSQGNTESNFMPSFDDFSLWDDVIHPFFLSLGVYLVSFGLMIVIGIGAVWYGWSSMTSGNDLTQQKSISTVMPDAQNDLTSAKQIPQVQQVQKQLNENSQWKNGQMPNENGLSQKNPVNSEEAEFQRLEEMIRQNRKAQLESVVGKNPEEEQAAFGQMTSNLYKTATIFVIPMLLALIWGLFYFPAACAVAGYTRSFTATLNPSVGLDTIKHLGFDYAKILAMSLILILFSGAVGLVLNLIFSPFNLPRMGNVPAQAVGSFFTFYLSIVFSVVLGYAIYKNSEKLTLYRG